MSSPSLVELPDQKLVFSFKKNLVLDKSVDLEFTSYTIQNKEFLDAVQSLKESGPSQSLLYFDKETFYNNFGGYFTTTSSFASEKPEQSLFYYTESELSEIIVLEKSIKNQTNPDHKLFDEYLSQLSTDKTNQKTNTQPIDNKQTHCPQPIAYTLKIHPTNIKVGLDGILKQPLNLIILANPPCQDQKLDLRKIARDVSYSFVVLILSNFLQDILFSLMNNKDILDIIKYHHFPKDDMYTLFDDFFGTFDCNQFFSICNDSFSYSSNKKIRGFFYSGLSRTNTNMDELA